MDIHGTEQENESDVVTSNVQQSTVRKNTWRVTVVTKEIGQAFDLTGKVPQNWFGEVLTFDSHPHILVAADQKCPSRFSHAQQAFVDSREKMQECKKQSFWLWVFYPLETKHGNRNSLINGGF